MNLSFWSMYSTAHSRKHLVFFAVVCENPAPQRSVDENGRNTKCQLLCWEYSGRTGLPPFLLPSSPQVLGSNSGWQARFWGRKGCRLSCPTATNAQGSVQEAWSPCRAQGTHPRGAQASESILTDPPVCRLRETLVWAPRVGMASNG